jgi:hypothetical protein
MTKDWFDSDIPPRNRLPAQPLPSILGLGRLAHSASLAIDVAHEADDGKKRERVLFDQGAALRDLLLTFRATNLSDAVTQLYVAFIAADDLLGFELPPEDRDRNATAVRRALLSAIPAIAEAAGLDLAEIGAEYIPEFATREFPVEA